MKLPLYHKAVVKINYAHKYLTQCQEYIKHLLKES